MRNTKSRLVSAQTNAALDSPGLPSRSFMTMMERTTETQNATTTLQKRPLVIKPSLQPPRDARAGVEISRVPYRADSLCAVGKRSEFLPQIADVHVNGAIKDAEVPAQHLGQAIPADNLSSLGKKLLQY